MEKIIILAAILCIQGCVSFYEYNRTIITETKPDGTVIESEICILEVTSTKESSDGSLGVGKDCEANGGVKKLGLNSQFVDVLSTAIKLVK